MSVKTFNGACVEDILNPPNDDPNLVERIAHRKVKLELAIVEPDPQWPQQFELFKSRILSAFTHPAPIDADEPSIIAIEHVGSTSVPGLPAKPCIDIDLILSPNTLESEKFYIPRLEAAGFQYLFREPHWHGHRFLVASEPMFCNLHVFSEGTGEHARHLIFRNYLRNNPEERDLYATVKREVIRLAKEGGEDMMAYTNRKNEVVSGILQRAFRELGLS